MEKYGCVIPTLTNQPNETSCNMNKEMIKEFWILLGNIANCTIPCADMVVTFPPYGSDSGSQNEAFVKFYLKNIIRIQSSFWSYTPINLLAEIGGYVGLLLGMSLLDVTKVISWLLNLHIQLH